jgi:PEGA domain
MARRSRVVGKLVAAVMAGVIGVSYGGGAAFVSTAQAQPKPVPAATGKPTTAAAPAPGASAGAKVDAKKAYADGEKKFKANDFANALVDFLAADSVKQTSQAARYIGLCHDNLGHLQDAVTAYERFLTDVPPKLADQGEEIKKRVAAIKAIPGKVHVETTPAGATVALDGKVLSAVTPTDVEATPGRHTIKLSADGRVAQEKDLDVAYASKQDLRAELEEKPAPPPPPPPPPEPVAATPPPAPPPPIADKGSSMVPALITGGLAVVALGVGTVFGVMALGDKSDFDKNPTSGKADDGENHALIADMAFGVAVTLGVTSAVLFFSSGSSGASAKADPPVLAAKAKTKDFSFTPIVTPHGGGAGATLRF